MQPLEVLFDQARGAGIPLPDTLGALYGPLRLRDRCVYANFVSSVDGVVALGEEGVSSGPAISGRSDADRFVMGLLRALAGAVLIGGGTMRDDPGHLWTPGYIFPSSRAGYTELRRRLQLSPQPQLAIVTASGDLDPSEKALAGALVLTTEAGANRLLGQVPGGCRVEVVGRESFTLDAALRILRSEGHRRILSEAGPRVFTELLTRRLVDELFLTLSPVLAGRSSERNRLGLVEGAAFPGASLSATRLLSVRRHREHLLLRYQVMPRERTRSRHGAGNPRA